MRHSLRPPEQLLNGTDLGQVAGRRAVILRRRDKIADVAHEPMGGLMTACHVIKRPPAHPFCCNATKLVPDCTRSKLVPDCTRRLRCFAEGHGGRLVFSRGCLT